jgi:hypothetical protein
MSCAEDVHEGEVTAALNGASLLAIGLEVFHFSFIEGFLSRPLEGFCPGVISENV